MKNTFTFTFDNLIDVNTQKTVVVKSDKLINDKNFEEIGKRAEAFGKNLKEVTTKLTKK